MSSDVTPISRLFITYFLPLAPRRLTYTAKSFSNYAPLSLLHPFVVKITLRTMLYFSNDCTPNSQFQKING